MLLRHNFTLKTWYKFFANKFENILNEDTFSLNLEGFWKIARDVLLILKIGKIVESKLFFG
jgi:hypothetical protein